MRTLRTEDYFKELVDLISTKDIYVNNNISDAVITMRWRFKFLIVSKRNLQYLFHPLVLLSNDDPGLCFLM